MSRLLRCFLGATFFTACSVNAQMAAAPGPSGNAILYFSVLPWAALVAVVLVLYRFFPTQRSNLTLARRGALRWFGYLLFAFVAYIVLYGTYDLGWSSEIIPIAIWFALFLILLSGGVVAPLFVIHYTYQFLKNRKALNAS